MKSRMRKKLWGAGFLLPSLLGVLLFFVVPFGINIIYSFSRSVSAFAFVGLKNYRALFASEAFQISLKNTMLFLLAGIFLLLLLSNLLALFFDWAMKKKAVLAGLALMGSIVPMVIPTGSVLVFMQKLFAGMLENHAFAVLLLLFLWKNTGYGILVVFTGIHTIAGEVFEAARLDGANGRQLYVHIILPQIASFLSFSVIMGIIGIFKMYRESYLLFGEYPQESIYMLQNFLNNNFYSINYQRLTTSSIVFTLLLSVILLVVFLGGNRHER